MTGPEILDVYSAVLTAIQRNDSRPEVRAAEVHAAALLTIALVGARLPEHVSTGPK
jgi:hypothetical protein